MIQDHRDLGALIPSALDDYGLSPDEFRIYCRIARRANGGHCWESVGNMASHCQMNVKTARKAIALLTAAGLITQEPRLGATNIITLTKSSNWVSPNLLQSMRLKATPTKSGRGTKSGTTKLGTPTTRGQGGATKLGTPPLPREADEGIPFKESNKESNLLSHAEARDAGERVGEVQKETVSADQSASIPVSANWAGQEKKSSAAAAATKKAPQSKRKSKSSPERSPEEFERWWKVYYDFCLDVDQSAGKRAEAAAAWDDILADDDCLDRVIEGTDHYMTVKRHQFKNKGEAKAVSHGIRYLRDLKWQEALDHKRHKSSPVATAIARKPLHWSSEWPSSADDDLEVVKIHWSRLGLGWESPEFLDWVSMAQEQGEQINTSTGFYGLSDRALAKLANDLRMS